MGRAVKIIKDILPNTLRQAIKRAIGYDTGIIDTYFRPCSPATVPELANCIFDLHSGGTMEGRGYYEFGLFRGYSLWFVQEMVKRFNVSNFQCHGFDSFAGLPNPKGIDIGEWNTGQYAVSKKQVENYLKEFRADFSMISLHEGYFSEEFFAGLLKTSKFPPAALILVDCDLYYSTVPVLRFVTNVISDGTIILFDDYNCFNASNDRGQRRALREFITENRNITLESLRPFGWHGQGFRIRIKGEMDVLDKRTF